MKPDDRAAAPKGARDRLPVVALVLANLLPLAGVALLDWAIGDVMVLFWAESAVIGFWNLARLGVIGRWMAIPLGLFFCVHFGGFMAGHFVFIHGFFLEERFAGAPMSDLPALLGHLLPAVLALFVSHGISFFVNFLGHREYEGRELGQQMGAPYARIVVMHLTIIFGGFLSIAFEEGQGALALLVLLTLGTDLRAHLREHAARQPDVDDTGAPLASR